MTIVVINKSYGVVVGFGGEGVGILGGSGGGEGAEGGVIVVDGNTGSGNKVGDVFVAVVGVEEVEAPVLGAHDERARGDGFRGVPDKLGADGVAVGSVQSLDAKEVVVDKAEVRGDLTVSCLLIVHAADEALVDIR